MAKKQASHLFAPRFQLAECVRELEIINGNLFGLKLGVAELIKSVQEGNVEHAKQVIRIYQLEAILDNLTTKD